MGLSPLGRGPLSTYHVGMKTCIMLAALILAPMTSSALDIFDLDWGRREVADDRARSVILQEMAGYQDPSLTPIKLRAKGAKTQKQLAKARTEFENWKMEAMSNCTAASRVRIKSYFQSQTSLVNALRTEVQTTAGGWGKYFDGKTAASSQEVQAEAPVASVRYNYAKVRGIAMSQGAKAEIVKAAIEEAMLQGVDPNLVLAIIQKESNFKADAVSSAGAIGVMQLMRGTACDMGVCDSDALFGVRTNIRAGIKYLRWITKNLKLDINLKDIKQSSGNGLRAIIASYNAGTGPVKRWLKQQGDNFHIRYAETRNYVSGVLGVLGIKGW